MNKWLILNTIQLEREHKQLVKGVNKMGTGKKKEMLLVEHLIGTEKRKKEKENTFKRVYNG